MKKAVYSITRYRKDTTEKITGLGYVTDTDLVIALHLPFCCLIKYPRKPLKIVSAYNPALHGSAVLQIVIAPVPTPPA
jgi:hypothetical protein